MPGLISVSEFVEESREDLNSPTTSTFVSRMPQCRQTVAALEEVSMPSLSFIARLSPVLFQAPPDHREQPARGEGLRRPARPKKATRLIDRRPIDAPSPCKSSPDDVMQKSPRGRYRLGIDRAISRTRFTRTLDRFASLAGEHSRRRIGSLADVR